MFDTSNFTRTDETEAGYAKRCRFLLERFNRETGRDWDLHPQELVAWVSAMREEWSPSYWRGLRAALVWYFKKIGIPSLSDSINVLGTEVCAPPTHTSARKKKSISDDELVDLANYLLTSGSTQVCVEAYKFLVSGIITGMRPLEWSQCDLQIILDPGNDVDEIRIVIQNAKATNGRAHGPTRTITLTNLDPSEKMALLDHWRAVSREIKTGTFPKFQRSCSAKIRYAGHKLWPRKRKRVTLYSARHQSMANCKASSLPKAVTAALHGHATDRTAGDHYGRKQYGVAGRVRASVSEEEVQRVRHVAKDWAHPRRAPESTPAQNLPERE